MSYFRIIRLRHMIQANRKKMFSLEKSLSKCNLSKATKVTSKIHELSKKNLRLLDVIESLENISKN